MDKRRKEGLCFEYGLPGYRADSYYKGKERGGGNKKSMSAGTRVELSAIGKDTKSRYYD